jgi:asparagine synthase (glutamine-hydrolysing)
VGTANLDDSRSLTEDVCGIAGIWRIGDRELDRSTLESILQAMVSRGPESQGVFEEGPLTLGHRRLAILDLTPAAAQPMTSRSGRLVVSFNGEIYNFREIRDQLGLHQADLRTTSDTEVLLEAWDRWGPKCLDSLVGPFAFALYDRNERALWLVRDRVGEKPLFHHEGPGVLTFASSIPALLRARWIRRRLDEDRLNEYLTLRYVVPPRTLVAGVKKLRPGHLLKIDEHGMRESRWWRPPLLDGTARTGPPTREEAVEHFDHLFRQACRRTLVSDVPCGLLLSDGIDSNAIRSVLKNGGADVGSYTFQWNGHGPPAPSSPAERESTDSGAEPITCDRRAIVDNMEAALSGLTEPVGDGSLIPTWLMIRAARPRSTVLLCGHGGDEILGGYRMSQERFRFSVLRRVARLPLFLSAPVVACWTHGAGRVAVRRRAFARSSAKTWPATVPYLIHRPLPRDDVEELSASPIAPDLAAIHGRYAECPPGMTDLDRMQYVLLETFFAANILPMADSVSMASSAELRMPYVDRDLLEFVLTLPREYRVARVPGHANTKVVLREWADAHLERALIDRKKRTFRYGSIRHLLRDPAARIRERICDAPFLRASVPGLESWTGRDPEFFHGAREGTLWALLTLSTWGAAVGLQAAESYGG